MKKCVELFVTSLLLVMILSGCAAHCDRSKNEPCSGEEKYDSAVLTGRPGSRTLEYKTAVYGHKKAVPVLLLHDMNGASWNCLRLAQEIADWGHRVYVPNLFPGEGMELGSKDFFASSRYLAKNTDWQVEKMKDSGPILEDIACMAREVSRRHGGSRVVVIGNCLTGIFPFGILSESCVSKVVLCQPATPLSNTFALLMGLGQREHRAKALGLSPDVVNRSLAAMSRDSTKRVYVFHYAHDPVAPMSRVSSLHDRLVEHNLAGRMKTYVLQQAGASAEPWWTSTETTCVPKKTMTPHSTLITSECCRDLRWFRNHLRQILSLP